MGLLNYLEESRWNIESKVLCERAGQMKNLLSSISDIISKKATLLLMLMSYKVKCIFNEDSSMLLDEAEKVCCNFGTIYK